MTGLSVAVRFPSYDVLTLIDDKSLVTQCRELQIGKMGCASRWCLLSTTALSTLREDEREGERESETAAAGVTLFWSEDRGGMGGRLPPLL